MAEFTPFCVSGNCPNFLPEQQTEAINQRLCNGLLDVIVKAGGAGFLEMNPCPHLAMLDIGVSDSIEGAEVREKLGIVGVYYSAGGIA